MKHTITTKGIAALWLRTNMPHADVKEQESLARVIDVFCAEIAIQKMNECITVMGESPTMSAAVAAIEAMSHQLERNLSREVREEAERLDFDLRNF